MTKVALPVVFERRFQFWWYTVSLARAVLRRFPSPEDGTTTSVEIMFQGVQALQLRSVYRRIAMRHATPDEAEVIVDQLDKIPGHPTLFVVLGDDLRAGWVACSVCFTDENDLDYIHKPALLIDGMWIPSDWTWTVTARGERTDMNGGGPRQMMYQPALAGIARRRSSGRSHLSPASSQHGQRRSRDRRAGEWAG